MNNIDHNASIQPVEMRICPNTLVDLAQSFMALVHPDECYHTIKTAKEQRLPRRECDTS